MGEIIARRINVYMNRMVYLCIIYFILNGYMCIKNYMAVRVSIRGSGFAQVHFTLVRAFGEM
jgi:hypothetical protein